MSVAVATHAAAREARRTWTPNAGWRTKSTGTRGPSRSFFSCAVVPSCRR